MREARHPSEGPEGTPEDEAVLGQGFLASLATEPGGTLYQLGVGWVHLPRGSRRSPEEMAALFADKSRTRFVGDADRATVAGLYAGLHTAVAEFDRRTMPLCTRLLDEHLYRTRRTAMPVAMLVGIISVGGFLAFATVGLSSSQPGMVFAGLVIFLILVPCFMCLPSRLVRSRAARLLACRSADGTPRTSRYAMIAIYPVDV